MCYVSGKLLSLNDTMTGCLGKGDVTLYDSQRRFLAQHSVAMLGQCCNYSNQCRNNVAMLCCAKNRRCKLAWGSRKK